MGSLLQFPSPFAPAPLHRATAMLHGHRVKVTANHITGPEHITILVKCIADNRQRQYKTDVNKNWVNCGFIDATHIFFEVPNASNDYNDKIGTFYPRTGRWYDDDNSTRERVQAAFAVAHWLANGCQDDATHGDWMNFHESSECGQCGQELTDPVSIARGFGPGPNCWGAQTGSQHQVKNAPTESDLDNMVGAPNDDEEAAHRAFDFREENAKVDELEVTFFGDPQHGKSEFVRMVVAKVGTDTLHVGQLDALSTSDFAVLLAAVNTEVMRRVTFVESTNLGANDDLEIAQEAVDLTRSILRPDRSFMGR